MHGVQKGLLPALGVTQGRAITTMHSLVIVIDLEVGWVPKLIQLGQPWNFLRIYQKRGILLLLV